MEGNQMKMREALEKIRIIAQTFMDATRTRHVTDSARIDVGNIEELANAALSAPPRQCDVGTAEEQIKRWEKFCQEHHEYWKPGKNLTAIQRCNCPCHEGNGCNYFIWAQMPYAEEGAGK